jgi:hypothetical protein
MISGSVVLSMLVALGLGIHSAAAIAQPAVTAAEARKIARDAYIYGYPMVDSYRIQYAYFVDRGHPEFKAPWNSIRNLPRVVTSDDKTVQTPNSDTPYSFVGADLRAEPLVLTVPVVEKGRYFSLHFIDLYTFNFAFVGSRTTGNGGGRFLLAGPRWKGEKPAGVKAVIRSETDLVVVGYRTQLFGPNDLDSVKKIQAGYTVQTLSEFLGKPARAVAPPVEFVPPLARDQQRTSLTFFEVLDFLLQFCPIHPTEKDLRARFARLGIGAGARFDPHALSPEIRQAVEAGMADGWQTYEAFKKRDIDTGKVASGDMFGTRERLKNDYLRRMAGAILGIWGVSKEEAMYPIYTVDADGHPLDGATGRYALRFAPGQLPPVNAFWSLTMYELPSSLLTVNPIDRYLINSPMLPSLRRDPDGGLTLIVQHASPGKDQESNWLPAPNGPFMAILRMYWPKPAALDGTWKQPPLTAVK